MSDDKDIKQRSFKDRRGPTDRRLLNLGFGPRGKDRRKEGERRAQEERRRNWARISRWSSALDKEDDDE